MIDQIRLMNFPRTIAFKRLLQYLKLRIKKWQKISQEYILLFINFIFLISLQQSKTHEQLFRIQTAQQSNKASQDVCYQSIRNYQVVSDRKARRQEQFQARRKQKKYNQVESSLSTHQVQQKIFDLRFETEIKEFLNQTFTQDMLPQLADCLTSQNVVDVLFGTIGLRKLLQLQHHLIKDITSLKIDQFLYNLLGLQSFEHLQYQVVRCLNFLTFQNSQITQQYIRNGIVDKFLTLLQSKNLEIVEFVLLTFSNIFAQGCKQVKQYALQQKFTQKIYENVLLRLSQSQQFGLREKSIIELGYSTIASIYLLNSEQKEEHVRVQLMIDAIQYLKNIIQADFIEDLQVFSDSVYAIFVHCQRIKSKQELQMIVTQMLLAVIVSKLDLENQVFIKRILRPIGNFIAAVDDGIQMFMKMNILQKISKFLKNQSKTIRRNACWILSNIAAEESASILNHQNGKLMDKLTHIFIQDELQIKKEILYVLANISTQRGNFMMEQYIRDNDIIEIISIMLKQDSDELVVSVLKNVYLILNYARQNEKQQIIIDQFLKNGYYHVLEDLQQRQSKQIYRYVSKILDKFFICDEFSLNKI